MSGSLNEASLIGNVGADPEVKRTQDGKMVVNLSLATSETWRDKATGERKEKTEWHRIVIWNEGLCKVAEQYVRKGQKLFIRGAIQTRKWTDKDGNDKYSTEIVLNGYGGVLTMLDKPQGSSGETDRYSEFEKSYGDATGRSAPPRRVPAGGRNDDMSDDIPF